MRRFLLLPMLWFVSGQAFAATPLVEMVGQHPRVKLEHVVSGHLTELNGKYKLRVSEVTYDLQGRIGPHHHAGPGIRCVQSGSLTYTEGGSSTIYNSGDCFYESGDTSHTAKNDGAVPVVLLNFELLPAGWTAGSSIPPPGSSP